MPKISYAIATVLASVLLLGKDYVFAQQSAAPAVPPAAPSIAHTPTAKTKSAAATKSATPLVLKTQTDKFSYALGMNLGKSLHAQTVAVDTSILLRGIKDSLAGRKLLLTDDEARSAIMAVQNQLREKQMAKMQEMGQANKKEGEMFLAANKAKPGVVTLPSGLQYKILTQGGGAKPTANDSVVCNYRGTLINGTEFDSSTKHGGPATFPVSGVIKGWTEALQLMPVGSKWQLFVPSALAYGERGAGGDIGPDATLVFEVELVSIVDKGQQRK